MAGIVIVGGGIIGCSVAYFLADKGVPCTIVEQEEIACAASGKAGGFLARGWSDGTDLEQLSRVSYDLHMHLMTLWADCDYRKLDTFSVTVNQGGQKHGNTTLPAWLDGPVTQCSVLGNTSDTAQVHPFKLSNRLLKTAMDKVETTVRKGKVTGLEITNNIVTGVKIGDEIIAADKVVITMGPWTGQVKQWVPIPKVNGHRAHSIIIRPTKDEVTPHALFVEYSGSQGRKSPEVYPRPDGTVYVCGMSDNEALPMSQSLVAPNKDSCAKIKAICDEVSGVFKESPVVAEQACYLPVTNTGVPLIGQVPGVQGLYIGAGHSCWGILNAPATGKALSELIVDGKSSCVDLRPFDPAKFLH